MNLLHPFIPLPVLHNRSIRIEEIRIVIKFRIIHGYTQFFRRLCKLVPGLINVGPVLIRPQYVYAGLKPASLRQVSRRLPMIRILNVFRIGEMDSIDFSPPS